MLSPTSARAEAPLGDNLSPATGLGGSGEMGDVESALQGLVEIKDQRDLERDVSSEVKAATLEDENKKDQDRITSLRTKISAIQEKKEALARELMIKQNSRAPPRQIDAVRTKILALDTSISELSDEIVAFEERIEQRKQASAADFRAQQRETEKRVQHSGPTQQDGEDRRAFLIRTGRITPFAPTGDSENDSDDKVDDGEPDQDDSYHHSHQVLYEPGFSSQLHRDPIPVEDSVDTIASNLESEFGLRPRKRTRTRDARDGLESDEELVQRRAKQRSRKRPDDDDDYSEVESTSSQEQAESWPDRVVVDDANERRYNARLTTWVEERKKLRRELESTHGDDVNEDGEEWSKPTPGKPDLVIMDDYRLPQEVGAFLFPFQRVGIQWLSELHKRREGGILCDEMGLGKTGEPRMRSQGLGGDLTREQSKLLP
jgi:DNA excision repair protein ERCC-6